MARLWVVIIFPLVFLSIFNPYTVYGKPGVIVGLLFALVCLINASYKIVLNNYILPLVAVLAISLWGVLISYVNDIGQFDFLYATLSFVVFLISAFGFSGFLYKKGVTFDLFVKLIFYVLLFNSVFIILEANFSGLRDSVEAFLAPAGNIDWTRGIRYRGLAASGGSGLSICCALGIVLAFHLFKAKQLSLILLVMSFFAFLVSVLFIGRTGLVFIPMALIFYFLALFFTGRVKVVGVAATFGLIVFIVIVFTLFYEVLYDYLETTFGAGFINYSFGFLLKGSEGFKEEGTASVILGFMTVLPLGLPEAFIGLGFYGGSDFTPWTDSGYARVLLSVGFILGTIYYISILRVYSRGVTTHKPLLYTMIFILMLAEVKGSFLFSAYGARAFVLILAFYQVEKFFQKRSVVH